MTRRRWIADQVAGDRAALIGPHAYHLCRVLRARVGQVFDIATGTTVRRGRIIIAEEDRVEFDLLEEVKVQAVPPLTLLLSIFKFDRMEWAIEKCTELGVARIAPVVARRTERHLALAAERRVDRWRRIGQQAAEQSRRVSPPEILNPLTLSQAFAMTSGRRIVLNETEQDVMLGDLVHDEDTGELLLAVGPEGGWAPEELQAFGDAAWSSASLGTNILRTETAAIVAVALAQSALAAH
ncbi:MAG: 16S rRNA (uracil(1498)-N(3))-methyltransferase [Acidobacteriales bacterium]|nr:16S rRNA (uracil(1498)-N(3))-methyltransferase [Terriglobales bacterium]